MTGFSRVLLGFVFTLAVSLAIPVYAEDKQKAVLVTGASSGIGLKITEHLAAAGHFVYAGARKPDDIARLSAMDNVQGIRLDVTVQDEIDAAVQLVRDEGRGLYGIVNNAGVNVVGPVIELDEGELDFLFDVNIYGPYRITRAFAPLVIESQGRINNVSSISGILTGPLYGIYAMSKHALEAYTDALAVEMNTLGVKVSAVEPGNYKSKIGDSRCERFLSQDVDPEASYFQDYIKRVVENCENRPENTSPEPDDVAVAVLHALFDDNPRDHYMVVPTQFQAEITIRKAIEELVRYNEGHAFSYSKEELVEMLEDEFDTGDAFIRSVSGPR
jgi:NAD(P)-dependent dehydrogenase (short-subunit alcohol dehydrogenase family)